MGFPWKKVATVGLAVGTVAAPGIMPFVVAAVHAVEDNFSHLKGADKKAAALAMVMSMLEAVEGAAGRDLLNNPVVASAVGDFVDAYVSLMNAVAAVKAAKNQPQG